jgi:tRNA(Ile)-lysidine synthase
MLSSSGMEDLLVRVRRFAGRYGLLPVGETIVVGVSGGPDSLALLHLLRRLSPELGLGLHVAHLNHGLRGAEAGEDARLVAGLAELWGLPHTLGRTDVRSLADGLSLEEAARRARYRFLAEVAEAVQASTIAVGHNAGDQAETVLMHLLRGSGVAGLRGMLPRTALADYRLGIPPGARFWLVRPLLDIPRGDIERYCAEQGLEPRFDRSNEDRTFYRNRLRHELLPLLEGYNPAIREVLARTAGVMAGDAEILRANLDAAWREVALPSGPGEILLDLAGWRELGLGLQRAVLREAIHRLRRDLRDINWEHVERAVWLAREGATGQSATLAGGLALRIGYGSLRIGAQSRGVGGAEMGGACDAPWVSEELLLEAPGETALPGDWRVIAELSESSAAGVQAGPWEAWLDAQAVGSRLILRPRRPGDRFQPQGMGGHSVKLNEFMINLKVPRDDRASWPLLEGRNGLAWVCGLRVDERAAVSVETKAVWHVVFVKDPCPGHAERTVRPTRIAASDSEASRLCCHAERTVHPTRIAASDSEASRTWSVPKAHRAAIR